MKADNSKWASYFCNVNDKLASIFLNLSLCDVAPIPQKGLLLWVWLYFKKPKPDGLSDSSEADTLFAIEEALQKQMENRCDAILCGRITTQGRREFYFYGQRNDDVESVARGVLRDFGGYRFDCATQADTAWDQYLNVLYPSPEDLQKIENRNVLDTLERNGDDPMIVREVTHWVFFQSGQVREDFARAAASLGYRETHRYETAPEQPFAIVVARDQQTTQQAIDDAVIEVCQLTKYYGGEYDGWETQVNIGSVYSNATAPGPRPA